MKILHKALILPAALLLYACAQVSAPQTPRPSGPVNAWLTTADQSQLLARQKPTSFAKPLSDVPTILVDDSQIFQQMDGFGGSMTESSAWLIATKMNPSQRRALMTKLFDPKKGIGVSFLRQPVGASDFALSDYSFDDMPTGQSDASLKHFSIARDRKATIPVMKQALALNPKLKVMMSPWSAPAWMKTNESFRAGGSLKDDAYETYAHYLLKAVQGYESSGIPVYALTVQNEPANINDFATMAMTPGEQAEFVGHHLGPVFAAAGVSTKILLFDHNWDDIAYPLSILDDADARAAVAGTAVHCYEGEPDMMLPLQSAYPDKGIYLTECSGGSWRPGFAANLEWIGKTLLIESVRDYAKTVVLWNMALDTHSGPHTPDAASCSMCEGFVTIDRRTGRYTFNVGYYAMGHASKFVKPGAIRIASGEEGEIETVAFKNPDGSHVLIAFNAGDADSNFQVQQGGWAFSTVLPAKALATFTW